MAKEPPHRRALTLPGGVAAVVVTASLWWMSGGAGLVGGGVLLVAWAVLPATYAFAVGQVVFVAVTRPDTLLDAGLLPLLFVELGLIGVLVGPTFRTTERWHVAAWMVLGGCVLGGVTLASYLLWGRVRIAAAVVASVGFLTAYGLHRYELVVLGKVSPIDNGRAPQKWGTPPDDSSGHADTTQGPDGADLGLPEDGIERDGSDVTSHDEGEVA